MLLVRQHIGGDELEDKGGKGRTEKARRSHANLSGSLQQPDGATCEENNRLRNGDTLQNFGRAHRNVRHF